MATIKKVGKARVASGNVTVSDANTGVIIVPARAGEHIIVTDFWVRAIGGAAATLTAAEIQGTGGTVVAGSVPQASLTQNVVNRPETTNVVATNLAQPFVLGSATMIPKGEGLRFITTGSTATVASSFDYMVEFIYEAA